MRVTRSAGERVRRAVVLLLIGAAAAGCYRVASRNRIELPVSRIAVLPLENETSTFRIEQLMTRALVQGFVEKTRYQLTHDPDAADATVSGAITRLVANPVIFGRGSFGNTYLVTVSARVEMRDKAGKLLFHNDRFVFREQYVLNQDVDNFFTELNPALERVSRDFASSVVTSILENW